MAVSPLFPLSVPLDSFSTSYFACVEVKVNRGGFRLICSYVSLCVDFVCLGFSAGGSLFLWCDLLRIGGMLGEAELGPVCRCFTRKIARSTWKHQQHREAGCVCCSEGDSPGSAEVNETAAMSGTNTGSDSFRHANSSVTVIKSFGCKITSSTITTAIK